MPGGQGYGTHRRSSCLSHGWCTLSSHGLFFLETGWKAHPFAMESARNIRSMVGVVQRSDVVIILTMILWVSFFHFAVDSGIGSRSDRPRWPSVIHLDIWALFGPHHSICNLLLHTICRALCSFFPRGTTPCTRGELRVSHL